MLMDLKQIVLTSYMSCLALLPLGCKSGDSLVQPPKNEISQIMLETRQQLNASSTYVPTINTCLENYSLPSQIYNTLRSIDDSNLPKGISNLEHSHSQFAAHVSCNLLIGDFSYNLHFVNYKSNEVYDDYLVMFVDYPGLNMIGPSSFTDMHLDGVANRSELNEHNITYQTALQKIQNHLNKHVRINKPSVSMSPYQRAQNIPSNTVDLH